MTIKALRHFIKCLNAFIVIRYVEAFYDYIYI